jgi:hypothetical protein
MLNLSSDSKGVFCDLCKSIAISSDDCISKSNFGVCRECELKFVQSRKEEWADGWRPTDKEVKKHVEEIEKRVLSILSEIDNYI